MFTFAIAVFSIAALCRAFSKEGEDEYCGKMPAGEKPISRRELLFPQKPGRP